MTCEVLWTSYGDAALAALERVVGEARARDLLAPVTVVTPSPSVAVATRRALARSAGGTVGVGFHSLGAVAEQLASARLAAAGLGAGVDRELVVTAVRVALGKNPGAFGSIAGHRVTWERIADAVAEIDTLGEQGIAQIRAAGLVPAEVVRLRDEVRARVGPLGRDAVVALATEVVRDGGPRVGSLGTVVVHLPDRFSSAELGFLAALATQVPVRLLLGATGDAALDRSMAEHVAPLAPTAPPAPDRRPVTAVISANDVDDEVRAAVRRILALADAGTPLHRMAVVHPSGPPYARVVADVLGSAGVPFSGPSTRRLSQTVAGRVLLGVVDVDGSRFGRHEVVDLWATGVVVDVDGHLLPAALFDERSRRLGVIRDPARWHATLDTDDARLRDRRSGAGVADHEHPDEEEWVRRRLDENARLRAAVTTLEELCARRPTTWPAVAEWAGDVLDRLCGPVRRRSWPDVELDADAAIRVALGRLAALHDVEPEPSVEVVRDTIRTVLDAPAPRPTRTGIGLLVTTADAPPLVPLDAVAVVGLSEGHLPRVAGDDALLGDELRRAVGLSAADDTQRGQRRAFLASLASAGAHRIVSHARHDQRSGRALVPSRWLVEVVHERSGIRPDTETLMAGHDVAGVTLVPSHGAGLRDVGDGVTAALHAEEHAFAALVAAGRLEGHPAADDPVLTAGSELLEGRRSHDFTRFDGNLGGDGVDVTSLGVLSPTSLETYARCPRRWFFAHALRLRAMERPEEIHRLPPRDRGTLAHAALERFFDEAIADDAVPAPGSRWSEAARQRLRAITDEECERVEARGITGHPRWWAHDRAEIHRVLQRVLDGDEEQRAAFGTMPVAVELTFGRDGLPPLSVDLGDGRSILLAGQADRVDARVTDHGTERIVVWDYKYSGTTEFEGLSRADDDGGDPLAAGTKIQLVAYGMAALDTVASDDGSDPQVEVQARYWFLKPPHTNTVIGYAVTDELRDRFRRVLRVLADGIGSGRFPARPGEHQYHRGNFANCAWCDFDPICPRDRDEEWERARSHPSLAELTALAEEGSASVLADLPEEAR